MNDPHGRRVIFPSGGSAFGDNFSCSVDVVKPHVVMRTARMLGLPKE